MRGGRRRRAAGAWGLGLAAVLLGAPGCVTEQGIVTVASLHPFDVDPTKLDFDRLPVMRDIQGSDTAITSVLFVPTFIGPSLDAAVGDAIERGHGDVLTRARVRTTKYWFLVGIEHLTVRGNVVDLPESP